MSVDVARGAHQWRGLIEEYRHRLPVDVDTPVVTLREGGTPLVYACVLAEMTGCQVWLKYDGANPTGSFKDRGMTMAISKAAQEGASAVICASTGNTSASAAAYAVKAGMVCAVLVPDGKIAMGKLAQAMVHGAKLLQVQGNFDDCLTWPATLPITTPCLWSTASILIASRVRRRPASKSSICWQCSRYSLPARG